MRVTPATRMPSPPKLMVSAEAEWVTADADGYRLHVDQGTSDDLSFAASVVRTLNDRPRWLHCRWLYDEAGSEIYERITEQPEYYLTRAEDRILAEHAKGIRRAAGNVTLVELGSGSSTKTRRLLDAWHAEGDTRYIPIDISRSAIEQACVELSGSYRHLALEGMAARYTRALPLIAAASPLLLLFLGSSIGNFNDEELDEFLGLIATSLQPRDTFLVGFDLVKATDVLDAAYNDAAGWTERFMMNVLARMNRELDSGIPLDRVRYEGSYNEALERVEMYLRFTADVDVRLPGGRQPIAIKRGEGVMMEISRKFRLEQMMARMHGFGLVLQQQFTDPDGLVAVLLLTRVGGGSRSNGRSPWRGQRPHICR